MSNKALLIIDMQRGSFTHKTPRYDTNGVVNRINMLAENFRLSGNVVIFIQHDGSTNNEYVPQTDEWKLLPELDINENDILIDKYANDIFYNSKLKYELDTLNIDELYITGCATDFCVEATIQSALTKDYNITVVKDGHTTGNRPHLTAKKVIEHYNWVWQNMIPTKGFIKVEDFSNIINSL